MRCRSNGTWVLLALAWLAGSGHTLAAQDTPSAQTPSVQTRQALPLTVDSDPVPTPDNDAATPSAPTSSQPPPAGLVTKENGRYTLKTNTYEVRLNASVLDSSGRPAETLPQEAFRVYEDGVPQTIVGFRHEDTPVSIGILIDSSGSMYDKRAAVDAASLDLVQLSNAEDEAFLVDFSSEAYIDQDFTGDIGKLQQGLGYIKPSGGTALYDAVIASADYLSKNAKRPKQVLLIITDGEDNASSASLESAIRRVQDLDGPAIYCIGLLFGEDVGHQEARHAKEVLQELAEQTGGEAYFPKALKDVDGLTREVAEDIRTQYSIEYRSTNPPSRGGYREIHVEAKAKASVACKCEPAQDIFRKCRALQLHPRLVSKSMRIGSNLTELVGNTPMVRINRLTGAEDAEVWVKLETMNPGGSIKDRAALGLVLDAERRGVLKPGGTICEATAGNTGVGLALIGVQRGYRVRLFVPEGFAEEKCVLMRALGAEVERTPEAEMMSGAVRRTLAFESETPGAFATLQFENPANPNIHEQTTAPEMFEQMDGRIDALVLGVGSAGTFTGIARFLKKKLPQVLTVAVETEGSVYQGGTPGPHRVEGIGASFVPATFDRSVCDRIVRVNDKPAFAMVKRMASEEGILAGSSSGAMMCAALEVARELGTGKRVATIAPDSAERYLSGGIFD